MRIPPALSHRRFRLLWLGLMISVAGLQMQTWALFWHIRGRMTGVNQIFFMGGPQLGEVEAGVVAQFFSTPIAIISGGIGCLVALAWISRRWPQLRTFNGDEAIRSAAPAN